MRIDRHGADRSAAVAGGSLGLAERGRVAVTGTRPTDARQRRRLLPVPDLDRRRRDLGRASPAPRARSPPRARRSCSSAPSTLPATPRPGRPPARPRPTPCGSTAPRPRRPTVTGGSLTWQNVASRDRVRGGRRPTPAAPASPATSTARSTDGGTTWGAPTGASATITAEGETLVQFRTRGRRRQHLAWAPASAGAGSTVRIDRTAPPVDPTVSGGSLAWPNAASVTRHRRRLDRLAGQRRRRLPVPHLDRRRHHLVGAADRHRRPSRRGRARRSCSSARTDVAGLASAWAPAARTGGSTVRIDRTAADRADRHRRLARLAERRARHDLAARLDRRPVRLRPLRVPHVHQRRQRPGRRRPRARRRRDRRGRHARPVPLRRRRRQHSAWVPAHRRRCQHGQDRPHRADRCRPASAAARPSWTNAATVTVTAARLDRLAGQRRRLLPVPHLDQRRHDLVGGQAGSWSR